MASTVQVIGLQSALGRIRDLGRQVRFAAAGALVDTGHQVRAAIVGEMERAFDRPTPWIRRSIWVDAQRVRTDLQVRVYPRDMGGKSVDPDNVLMAEVFGGARRHKRAEVALQRIGLLSPGWAAVPPRSRPELLDAYGNLRGPFIVQLLAYFKAFGEQGYRANMADKGRRRLAKVKRSDSGYLKVTGVQYFVSRGRGTWATAHVNRRGVLSRPEGQLQHLPPGIWERSGTHGAVLRPVLMFVRRPNYAVRLRYHQVAREAFEREFHVRFSRRLQAAVASAR